MNTNDDDADLERVEFDFSRVAFIVVATSASLPAASASWPFP
jgi:hypothetical protein